jgi:hypothetical protein
LNFGADATSLGVIGSNLLPLAPMRGDHPEPGEVPAERLWREKRQMIILGMVRIQPNSTGTKRSISMDSPTHGPLLVQHNINLNPGFTSVLTNERQKRRPNPGPSLETRSTTPSRLAVTAADFQEVSLAVPLDLGIAAVG